MATPLLRLVAAGFGDPRLLEAAGFFDLDEVLALLYPEGYGDLGEAAVKDLEQYLATAPGRANLARRGTPSGAGSSLDDSLWAARVEQDSREQALGGTGEVDTVPGKRLAPLTPWRPRAVRARPQGGLVAHDQEELRKW